MAIRISQRQMFTSMVDRMNLNLADLMETNLQGATEKKVNRPSDDPYGSAEILSHRSTLSNIEQYQDNLSTAKGWLNAADNTLGQVHTQLTRLFALAEQSASGSLTDEQRTDIAFEARDIFDQMVSLSNTQFNGRYIFSGHKTSEAAFEQGLGGTCSDPALANASYTIDGATGKTTLIQFTGADGPVSGQTFRYTLDGGKNWHTDGTVTGTGASASDPIVLHLPTAGQQVTIKSKDKAYPYDPAVSQVDPANVNETDNGTWLYLRPSAEYKGDDNDTQVTQLYGSGPAGSATGAFYRDVAVRVDSVASGVVTYSYSLDNGSNWTQGTADGSGATTNLPVPGGFLDISGTPVAGEQYIIRPHRANIDLTVGNNASITLNVIGKDVFGGTYSPPFSTEGAQPVYDGGAQNMFEVVGRFVGYLETNSQAGCQRALDEIKTAMTNVVNYRTSVGGRVNRVTATEEQLESLSIDEYTRMSYVEDIDVTELMTKMSQQQLAYNAVLKSSSMVMQMNLMNFL